ncbi:hypothetical protein Pla175_42350 [Pirellulimonas nuda]|uniref:Uncharacterized protein n=1 Tax=Pirellulimonas nuda TaxID=2528009 RepID=A0A518DHA3_9BACT|nr:hypothetical protein [Pirellulimonas nuda]QDU90822.1 hypothetical protein Pla175_42350 [Pirellulimonas nuda]
MQNVTTFCIALMVATAAIAATPEKDGPDLLVIDNGAVKVGIDRTMGAAITWLSWKDYPQNAVNLHDPGRLVQQSYYAGRPRDRTDEGQSEDWSPWRWNPIQGGGVGSWARVTCFEKLDPTTLSSETIPKLWDMPSEEAAAVLIQATSFEPGMPHVLVVRNQIICRRNDGDPWGPAIRIPQEVPACYFTRGFDSFESYLGGGRWRRENASPGPPWGKARPPKKAVACFNKKGHGVAVFSPGSDGTWNFGPHGQALSDGPQDGPCVHVAPISRVLLGPKSTYAYRYWLVVGRKPQIAAALDDLESKYAEERGVVANPHPISPN